MMPTELSLLEDFVVNNPKLERLEELIGEFNFFEAIGSVRQELRHSDFLAFLLNPSANHRMKDRFLKRFLMMVLKEANNAPINAIQIDNMDLTQVSVERESQNIDILIHNRDFVCLIENKIDSSEHSDQLNRYLAIVKKRFPYAKTIIPIFLSPDAEPPEDPESSFIPVGYNLIAELIKFNLQTISSNLQPDVLMAMKHYEAMLRRHILSNSEIAQLCRDIYQNHKAAIDLIMEHMPDMREDISNHLLNLIKELPQAKAEYSTKSRVRFFPEFWDRLPELQTGTGEWNGTKRVLLFEFYINSDSLGLYLMLGPAKSEIRQAIYQSLASNNNLFKPHNKLTPKWTYVYKNIFLNKKDYEDASFETLQLVIDKQWQKFVEEDYEAILEAVKEIFY